MIALVTVILLVAALVVPASATTVYLSDEPSYPAFEVNKQTETRTATWAEHAAESIATLAASPTGLAVQVAIGVYNAVVNRSMSVTTATINF